MGEACGDLVVPVVHLGESGSEVSQQLMSRPAREVSEIISKCCVPLISKFCPLCS